jgi:hypothetical protein
MRWDDLARPWPGLTPGWPGPGPSPSPNLDLGPKGYLFFDPCNGACATTLTLATVPGPSP